MDDVKRLMEREMTKNYNRDVSMAVELREEEKAFEMLLQESE